MFENDEDIIRRLGMLEDYLDLAERIKVENCGSLPLRLSFYDGKLYVHCCGKKYSVAITEVQNGL